MTVNTMMNKLAKVATGKKRTNDFVPIKGAVNHGKISTLKEMINFLLLTHELSPQTVFS